MLLHSKGWLPTILSRPYVRLRYILGGDRPSQQRLDLQQHLGQQRLDLQQHLGLPQRPDLQQRLILPKRLDPQRLRLRIKRPCPHQPPCRHRLREQHPRAQAHPLRKRHPRAQAPRPRAGLSGPPSCKAGGFGRKVVGSDNSAEKGSCRSVATQLDISAAPISRRV